MASGARLTLLSTFVLPQPMVDVGRISAREIVNAAIRDRRQKLEKLAAGLRRRGLKVKCVVEWDYPQHEAVVRHVLTARPDLLIAESGRHGRIARWILSNTDWELIRSCPCPLWLVRSGTLPKKPRLLVAVDPGHADARRSRLDSRLLGAAQALVGYVGGTMAIVHADDASDSQIDAVERLANRHHVPAANRYVIPGNTTRVLPEVAEDGQGRHPAARRRVTQPAASTLHRDHGGARHRSRGVRRVRRKAGGLQVTRPAPPAAHPGLTTRDPAVTSSSVAFEPGRNRLRQTPRCS